MLTYLKARFQERSSIGALIMAITALVVSALFVFAGHGDFSIGVVVTGISWTIAILVLAIPEAESIYNDGVDELHETISDLYVSSENLGDTLEAILHKIELLPYNIVKSLEITNQPAPVEPTAAPTESAAADPAAPAPTE